MDDYQLLFFTVSVVASIAAAAAFLAPPNSLLSIKLIKGPPKSKVAPIPINKAI